MSRTVPFEELPWSAPLSEIGCDNDPYLASKRQKNQDCDFAGVTFSEKTERCPIDKRASCIFQVKADIGLGKSNVNPYAVCSAVKFHTTPRRALKQSSSLAPGPVATRWTADVLDTYSKEQLRGWILYTLKEDRELAPILEQVYILQQERDLWTYLVTPTVDLLEKPELIRTILLYNWGRKPKINVPIRCVRFR